MKGLPFITARAVAVTALCLALAACAGGPKLDPKVVTQKVDVAVSKPCVPADVPKARETYPDDALMPDADPADRYLAIAASNLLRKSRLLQTDPVIEACRR